MTTSSDTASTMTILHISWEYPPLLYGGLGRHVHALAEHQAQLGHDVTVLTQQPKGASESEAVNDVHVVRVAPPSPEVPRIPEDLVDWTRDLDRRLAVALGDVVQLARPDVVHAHDWVVAHSATAAVTVPIDLPLVTTIHATEAGRHQGWVNNPLSQRIHEIEFGLANRSDRVIACSRSMRVEIHKLFDVPIDRIDVIPNGIDLSDWKAKNDPVITDSTGGTILFTGRLEWEKGIHVLLAAVRLLPPMSPSPRLLIAGAGTREEALKEEFGDLTDSGVVSFLGWVSESHLRDLIRTADVSVVPSIYEPFGLVALEAAAAGTPLIVTDVGGLADIVTDGITGRVVPPQDPDALSDAIVEIFDNPAEARSRARALRATLPSAHDWRTIANESTAIYRAAIADHPTLRSVSIPRMPAPSSDNFLT
jgi:glycogen(starch) synthase